MKTLFLIFASLLTTDAFCQKLDFEIINSTYSISDKELIIDISLENKSKDTVFIINPNYYFKNEYVNQLITEPYSIDIHFGDKHGPCEISMEGDIDWYKDFTIDYILTVPPKRKVEYSIRKNYGNYCFDKKGSYKIKLEYKFSANSYRIDQSKDYCNALLEKMSKIHFSDIFEVTIKE